MYGDNWDSEEHAKRESEIEIIEEKRETEEKKAEDSGRSTIHTSSSGVKHGGGSKKF